MTILVIVIVVSLVGITILIIVIGILVRVHRRIQMQSFNTIQTRVAPPSTLNSGVVYEEPDCEVKQDNTAL